MRVATLLVTLVTLSTSALGHIALWDEGMFGWDPSDPNQSEPVLPLMDLTFDQWWFHGYKNKPPAAGKFMTLPSGGTYKGQVACNKALTSYGQNDYQQTGIYACDGDDNAKGGIGAMHTSDQWGSSDPKDVKGCGLSIAYTSDENSVQPEDFAVISTNWTCPWFKHVDFQIPADLPPCPEGGCLCSWGWIHSIDAGSQQNYHLVYRCKVDGAGGTVPIPPAHTANKCDLPNDISNCTIGAKQPHYWFQKERNNNPQGTYDPPFYNGKYGFMNGAQTDLFATVGGSQGGVPAPAPPAAVSSAPPVQSVAPTSPSASTATIPSLTAVVGAATTEISSTATLSSIASVRPASASSAASSPSPSPSKTALPVTTGKSGKTCRKAKRSLAHKLRSQRKIRAVRRLEKEQLLD